MAERRQYKTRVRFDRTDRVTRHEIIRERAEGYGWMTIPDMAKEFMSEGLYSDEELKEAVVRWVALDIKEALRWRQDGLPFAGPTKDGLWKVRTRWSAKDYDFILSKRNKQLIEDYDIAVRLRDERITRWPEKKYGDTVALHRLIVHK